MIKRKDLAEMEAELARQQERLLAAKQKYFDRHRAEKRERAAELQTKISELDGDVTSAHEEQLKLRARLEELRNAEIEQGGQNYLMRKNVWEHERDSKLESLAKMKLQLETISKQRQNLVLIKFC